MRDYLGCLILNLKGVFPPESYLFKTKQECLAELRSKSGLDYGDDIDAWEAWVSHYKEGVARRLKGDVEHEQ